MSEVDELRAAQHFIDQGMRAQAQPILFRLHQSKNPAIALNAGLSLLAALDHVRQNDTLLGIADRCIGIASALGKRDIHAFLLVQKAEFLFRKLSHLLYQEQNLKLAANVFRWIAFSLQEDKSEYAALAEERKRLESDISTLEAAVREELGANPDHYFQGKILMGLAELSFSRFLYGLGVLVNAGPWKSKIMNLYYVRRWNLDKLIGYDRAARRKLRQSFRGATVLYEKALEEFSAGQYESDAAHVAYALALKHALTFRFANATKFLNQAKSIGNKDRDKNLFNHIERLEKLIKDKHGHPRNWLEELGWDLPRALRNQNRPKREPWAPG
jgi:hypothetical protein